MKIYVIGQSGSGKTFFSKKLSEIKKIEHLEMDALNVRVNYDLPKFYEEINKYIDSHSSWIIDGKYKKIRKRLIEEADQIYFIDLPLSLSIVENIKRELTINRKITKKFIPHLLKVVREFFSTRKQIYMEVDGHSTKLTVFRNRKQVNEFLKKLANSSSTPTYKN